MGDRVVKTSRRRPVATRWAAFLSDRVAHGYRWDREEGAWVSLCRTRTEEPLSQNDRATAIQSTSRTVPVKDDPYGCCLACWARSFPATRTLSGGLRVRARRRAA